MRIHISSNACDVIIFNGQGKLCQLTCARWRDLSNHTRMSTIRSKNPATLTRKFQWKSHSTTLYLSFHLKALLKTFPNEIKPTKCPAKGKKKKGRKAKKEGRRESEKKRKNCCVAFKPQIFLNFCFLRRPELRKLICCTWIRRKP